MDEPVIVRWFAVERWGGPIRWVVDGGVWFYRLLTLIVLVRLVAWEFGIHWSGDIPTLYITAIVVMSNQARARSGVPRRDKESSTDG